VVERTAGASWFPFRATGREREEGEPQTPGSGAALLPTFLPQRPAIPSVGTAQASPHRHPPRVIITAAAVAFAGLVLLGQGGWIYAKAAVAQILLEHAFAQTLATGREVKPWSWADTWPVVRIEVPRLHRSVIVLHGSSGQALAFGAGHVELTPEAGEPGTAVYSAHRDTHFAFLADIRIGDEIRVRRRDGAVARFSVKETAVVRWDASGIDPFAPGRNLVLTTCWPLHAKTAGPLRYLVYAEGL
jgi:sortase A